VVVDPSHSVGKASFVPFASLAAAAYGADGLNVETHVCGSKGIGDDPKQAITPAVLAQADRRLQGDPLRARKAISLPVQKA
jgi:3-deoxy-7-phosphoheptulonate synthase